MANCYDASAGTFTMKRLRTADAAYFAGVDRPSSLPEPIAVARGPFITGPQANAIGNSDTWVCGAAMPAAGDICWVLVNTDWHLRLPAATDTIAQGFLFPRGVVTNAAFLEGPMFGPADNMTAGTVTVASGGTNPYVQGPKNVSRGEGYFLPLDPAFTASGWDVLVTLEATAGGSIAQNAARLDMLEVRLIGYPVNVWGTGAIESVAAFRGS